ncbi:MAG: ATP-binding protein, partial [Spirosoma sp.]|nr:ATP-binding protein [Spirosoma sp.]
NGLHPEVIMTLVDFFRQQCEEKGHYIWLNTHSESVVKKLTTDEIVLVEKKQGATQIRQIKGRNIYDIPTDDAWLTGALGGGLPW